jgi:hypothetical protein
MLPITRFDIKQYENIIKNKQHSNKKRFRAFGRYIDQYIIAEEMCQPVERMNELRLNDINMLKYLNHINKLKGFEESGIKKGLDRLTAMMRIFPRLKGHPGTDITGMQEVDNSVIDDLYQNDSGDDLEMQREGGRKGVLSHSDENPASLMW